MMIALDLIVENPKNPNRMPDDLFRKLRANIKRTKHYPPLIVRPIEDGKYMLIDGMHRRLVLLDLGETEANCDVWKVSEKEADVALATLNTLRGKDDFRARAALVDSLMGGGFDVQSLTTILPESAGQLDDLAKLMAVDADVIEAVERVVAPQPEERAMKIVFVLFPGQHDTVRRALDHLKRANDLEGAKNADGQALEFLSIEYLSGVSDDADAKSRGSAEPPIGSGRA